jgi:hypothetical protein
LLALFLALGGGAAWGSELISGKRIVNHSIPEKKLTAAAVEALQGQRGPAGPQGAKGATGPPGPRGDIGPTGPQGPGAMSFNLGNVPGDDDEHLLGSSHGVDAYYGCSPSGVAVLLKPHFAADTVYASGDEAQNGTLASLQVATNIIGPSGSSTVNLDVIAWAGGDGTLSRFDLGGFHGATGCNVWGLIIPGS